MKRAFVFALALALPLAASALVFGAETDYSKIEVRTRDLGHGVYMFDGIGGNLGGNITLATGKDGAIMVDASFAPLSDKIKAAIAKLNAPPVRYLVDTHVHGDHTGGNENFAKSGTAIVAHENVRKRLIAMGKSGAWLPGITFTDYLTLHVDGQTADVTHIGPGHTDTDSFVYFPEANVLATGDSFTTIGFPLIDIDNGGSLDGFITTVGAMIDIANDSTVIVPGHGETRDKAYLIAYRRMIMAARGRIIKLIADGKSQDDAVAAKPMADLDAQWGGTLHNGDRFVAAAYRSLKGG